jgi:hypothetical protein|tara:strand:+ start:1538 stop:1954 length:417 start_codon:yes stop_codon:yes gene_type:complete
MKFNAHKWIKDFKYSKVDKVTSHQKKTSIREAFTPGDMYSNEFDYVGMLRFSAEMEIPEDLSQLSDPAFIQILKDLFESYTDVNYHTEAQDLGIAIDWIEDAVERDDVQKMRMELDRSTDYLESHKKAAAKTLKDIQR